MYINGRNVTVDYPERADGEYVTYTPNEIDELQLAYAMSVHKSQGSEYPTVILLMVPGHYIMLQRNLLYTAVTRARQKVILVGTKAAVQTAVDNDRTRNVIRCWRNDCRSREIFFKDVINLGKGDA